MLSNPIISVIVPSFNHAAFLPNAINSILAQTISNIEVIIVDDGSTDYSPHIIRSIDDIRVRSIILDKNQGAAEATNIGVRQAKAPLIAMCNSDDEWLPTKLANQLKIIHEDPSLGAVFTDVNWIDESGKQKPDEEIFFAKVFRQDNKSKAFWLRLLLEEDNCLCHPSILIKREVYNNCGLYNNSYRQLPDFDMWLRVLEKYEIFVMPNKTVRFRLQPNNTSKPSPANSTRTLNEKRRIIAKAFDRMDKSIFTNAFGSRKSPGDPAFCLPLEKVFYLVSRSHVNEVMFRDIGLTLLNHFMENEQNWCESFASYGLSADAYYTIFGLSSPWHDRRLLGPLIEKEENLLSAICSENDCVRLLEKLGRQQVDPENYPVKNETKVLKKNLDSLKKEFSSLVGSSSWQITKPLRTAKAAIYYKKGGSSVSLAEPSDFSPSNLLGQIRRFRIEINAIKNSLSWSLTRSMRDLDNTSQKI